MCFCDCVMEKCKYTLLVLLVGIAWAMHTASFASIVIKRNQLRKMNEGFDSIVASWEQNLVFDLSPVEFLMEKDYATGKSEASKWQGYVPEVVEGCYCHKSNRMAKTKMGMKRQGCREQEVEAGCKQIPASAKRPLSKWVGGGELFAARVPGTSFWEMHEKMDYRGKCSAGYKNCGDPSSLSKGHCIPQSIPGCPLTDISVSSASGLSKSFAFAGFNLFFDSKPNTNPISDLLIVQDHACFLRGHYPLASGRKKYELFEATFDNCQRDDSVQQLAEIGEKDLFDLNGVPYTDMAEYDVSNNFKYKLAFARTLPWSFDCWAFISPIKNKSQELTDLKKQYNILFIIFILVFCLLHAVIFFCILLLTCKSLNDDGKKCLLILYMIVRGVTMIMLLPILSICTFKQQAHEKFLNNIIEMECSDEAGNLSLKLLGASMSSWLPPSAIISLYIVGILPDFLSIIHIFRMNKWTE